KQLAEHGDKVDGALKTEIEGAIAETKTAIEGGDTDAIKDKAQALAQAAMKLGQAIYEKQAQTDASPTAEHAAGNEDVVDAEFSEVDDNKA
ncbi:molecular chaperone DnaK, partial [Acinetobacter baumannii]